MTPSKFLVWYVRNPPNVYNTIQYNTIYIYLFINLYMLCIYRMFFLFNLKYVSTSGGLYSSDVPLYFFY